MERPMETWYDILRGEIQRKSTKYTLTQHCAQRAQWTVQNLSLNVAFWDDARVRSWELLVPKGSKHIQAITLIEAENHKCTSQIRTFHQPCRFCTSAFYPSIRLSFHFQFTRPHSFRSAPPQPGSHENIRKRETALSKHKNYLCFLPISENETFDPSSFESLHKKDGVSWIHFIISYHFTVSRLQALSPQSSDAKVALSRLSISFWLSLKLKMSILACTVWANIASWFLMVPKTPVRLRWVPESFAPLVRAFKCSGFADFVATETLCVTIHFKATCYGSKHGKLLRLHQNQESLMHSSIAPAQLISHASSRYLWWGYLATHKRLKPSHA